MWQVAHDRRGGDTNGGHNFFASHSFIRERQEVAMKLQPLTTSSSPSYPTRQPRNAKCQRLGAHLRKVAVAVGTSALLGFASCGASEQHTDEIPVPGTPPATYIDHGNEPERDTQNDETTIIPIVDEDITHMAGGLRPPEPEPESESNPPVQEPSPTVTPIADDDIAHMAGGLRPPVPEPTPPQPAPTPTVTPITDDDPIHIAGGRRPPQVESPAPQIEPLQPVQIDRPRPRPDQQQNQHTTLPNQENKPPERIQVRLSGIMPAPMP